MKSKKPS